MSDEVDQAQEMSQDFCDRAIEANRRPIRKLQPRQKCYNCDTAVEGNRLFCDDECREDWEFRMTRVRGKYEVFSGAS